jgi:hypothetical protein
VATPPGIDRGGLRLRADASEECFFADDGYELPTLSAEVGPALAVGGSLAAALLDPDFKPAGGRFGVGGTLLNTGRSL